MFFKLWLKLAINYNLIYEIINQKTGSVTIEVDYESFSIDKGFLE